MIEKLSECDQFRIDGHIIKRGALIGQLDHLVPLGVGKLACAF